MARYTGPKSRIARKFGEGIFGADKVLSNIYVLTLMEIYHLQKREVQLFENSSFF